MHVFGLQLLGAALLGAQVLVTAQEAVANLRGIASQSRDTDTLLNESTSSDEVEVLNPEQKNVSDGATLFSNLSSMSSYECPECDRQCVGVDACDVSHEVSRAGWCWKFCQKPNWKCDHHREDQSPVSLRTDLLKFSGRWDILSFASYRWVTAQAHAGGHGVEVKADRGFGSLKVHGEVYQAVQFHFHCPSEHSDSDGHTMTYYACELHVVHETPGAGKRVVIALRYTLGSRSSHRRRRANPFLSRIGIPDSYSSSKPRLGYVENGVDLSLELAILKRGFYMYHGSLTTPPCTPNVLWIVAAEPVPISANQFANFHKLGLKDVSRESQSLGGRVITKYSR